MCYSVTVRPLARSGHDPGRHERCGVFFTCSLVTFLYPVKFDTLALGPPKTPGPGAQRGETAPMSASTMGQKVLAIR